MLQFLDVSSFVSEKIEIDDYIPLNIEWVGSGISPPYYWRTGNFCTSLLEIGIAPESQMIRSMTLTLADRINAGLGDLTLAGLPSLFGLPIFKPKDWSVDIYIDEVRDFEVFVGKTNLLLSLMPIDQIISTVTTEQVRFGLSGENYLVGIEVFDLTDEEILKLQSALSDNIT